MAVVAMSGMRVVSCLVVIALCVMLGGFTMMLASMLVMFCGFQMMFCAYMFWHITLLVETTMTRPPCARCIVLSAIKNGRFSLPAADFSDYGVL